MLIYGKNVAKEYLNNKKDIKKIYLSDSFKDNDIIGLINNSHIKVIHFKKYEMDKKFPKVNQGIVLEVSDYHYQDLNSINNASFIVLLDHIEDPHNFGAIIRTCEAAGVDGIIIPKDRSVSVNETVVKTSVGTTDKINIVQVTNLVNTINHLKRQGFWIVGTALEDSVDYRKIDYDGKIALIIGNEGKGISRLVRESCDFIANIPMYGKINSLNASVASGIMIYEVIRNRK